MLEESLEFEERDSDEDCKELLVKEIEKRMKNIFVGALQAMELAGFAEFKNYKNVRSSILRNANNKIREVKSIINNCVHVSPIKHTIRFVQPGVDVDGEIVDSGECGLGKFTVIKTEER